MQSLPSFFSTLTRWLWQCAYQKQAIRLLEGDGFQTRQSPRPLLRRTRPRHPIIGEKTTLATLLKKHYQASGSQEVALFIYNMQVFP